MKFIHAPRVESLSSRRARNRQWRMWCNNATRCRPEIASDQTETRVKLVETLTIAGRKGQRTGDRERIDERLNRRPAAWRMPQLAGHLQ